MEIAGKNLKLNHISGPLGVRGRNSDNRLILEKLDWEQHNHLKMALNQLMPGSKIK